MLGPPDLLTGARVAAVPSRRSEPTARAYFATAAALGLVALVTRSLAAAGGWFYADDLAAVGRVFRTSFLGNVQYGEGGHIAFLNNAVGYVFWRLSTFNWPAHVAFVMTTWAIAAALVLGLLVTLYGRRWGALVCWAYFLFASLMTPSLLWFSQATTIPGLLIPALGAALLYVRYSTDGRLRWLACMLGVLVVGLLWNERVAVLTPQLLLLVRIALWRSPIAKQWPVVVACSLLIVPYVLVYLGWADSAASGAVDLDSAMGLLRTGFLEVWLPALAGGPWLLDDSPVLARAAAGNPYAWLGAIGIALVIITGYTRSGMRALAAASVVLLAGVLDVVLVIVGRYSLLGEFALQEWRYYSQTAILVPLALAIMFMGPTKGERQTSPTTGGTTSGTASFTGAVVVALAIAWMAGASLTTYRMAVRWADNPARSYLTNTLADLRTSRSVELVDRQLPSSVINPDLTYATRASWVLAGATPRPVWDRASTNLRSIDEDGHLTPVAITGGTESKPGPVSDCGWKVTDRPVLIPLRSVLFDWNWVARFNYLSSGWFSAPARIGGSDVQLPIARGAGQTEVPISGPLSHIVVGPLPAGATLCIDRVSVGEASAGPIP